jgi:hypothetical protein
MHAFADSVGLRILDSDRTWLDIETIQEISKHPSSELCTIVIDAVVRLGISRQPHILKLFRDMEHGLILDTNHFNQIGHWVYTCESLILDDLSIDLDLPRANEVNTHSVPWLKFDFSCGKVPIATTR